MFDHHREHQAHVAHQAAVQQLQTRHDAYAAMLDTARTFAGTTAEGLLLASGETLFLEISDTTLIEERRGRGTYVGHSQGISVPVVRVGGRQIRYRVGATKGHYVQGDPAPTAIDTGTTYITSARLVFRGASQTRECAFAKLIGFDHDAADGSTTLSVSDRSKPTTIHYGPACAATFEFRLDLALAHFRGTVDELIAGLEADLAAIDGARADDGSETTVAAGSLPPTPDAGEAPPPIPARPVAAAPDPVGATPTIPATPGTARPVEPVPPQAGVPSAVAAGWYADPWHVAPLRWWDGSAWAWQTVDPSSPPATPT